MQKEKDMRQLVRSEKGMCVCLEKENCAGQCRRAAIKNIHAVPWQEWIKNVSAENASPSWRRVSWIMMSQPADVISDLSFNSFQLSECTLLKRFSTEIRLQCGLNLRGKFNFLKRVTQELPSLSLSHAESCLILDKLNNSLFTRKISFCYCICEIKEQLTKSRSVLKQALKFMSTPLFICKTQLFEQKNETESQESAARCGNKINEECMPLKASFINK